MSFTQPVEHRNSWRTQNYVAQKLREYSTRVTWAGNTSVGTKDYSSYKQDHEIQLEGRPPIEGTSDPVFRGSPKCYSPEDLLIASLSGCHMLCYLRLCSDAGVVVISYEDCATGTTVEMKGGGGRFSEVILHPVVVVLPGCDVRRGIDLHHRAHQLCFIANSMSFPVTCKPEIKEAG